MTYSAFVDQLPHCCGINEAGNFGYADDYDAIEEVTVEELLEAILDRSEGRPVMFNFKKQVDYQGTFNKEYDYASLRTLVRAHPKVVHVAKWINPGSKNRIDCYCIAGYKDE